MLIDYNEFSGIFSNCGFDITAVQYKRFFLYAKMLVEWNEKINLTGITDPRGIAVKHFLDSLLPLNNVEIPQGASIIDVGTGAGFPGLPIKIYRPDIKLTLLDSLNKRVNFLSAVCKETGAAAECVHARAEDCGRNERYREKFDFAAARAVAALPVLAEYCLPFVKVGGTFIAMKGPNENPEDGKTAIKLLGGEISDIFEYSLPDGDRSRRKLICVKKICPTEKKYPRNSGQISKKPIL